MIIDCCAKEGANCNDTNTAEQCRECSNLGTPVSRKTVLLMLKPDLLEQALTGVYRFCAARDCPIVYFEERGMRTFTANDLRFVVGLKTKCDPIPVCYCFGFDESHLRDELASAGSTTIPDRISSLIREGLCACDARNPSGNCCLGEVNRAVKRLQEVLVTETP